MKDMLKHRQSKATASSCSTMKYSFVNKLHCTSATDREPADLDVLTKFLEQKSHYVFEWVTSICQEDDEPFQ